LAPTSKRSKSPVWRYWSKHRTVIMARLDTGRDREAGLLQRHGQEHQWTKEAVQAVADATAAIERAASPPDRLPEPVIGFGAPIIESRSDRAAPVVQLTTLFVPTGAPRARRLTPVRRILGVFAGRR
jgi:hypothetical protein